MPLSADVSRRRDAPAGGGAARVSRSWNMQQRGGTTINGRYREFFDLDRAAASWATTHQRRPRGADPWRLLSNATACRASTTRCADKAYRVGGDPNADAKRPLPFIGNLQSVRHRQYRQMVAGKASYSPCWQRATSSQKYAVVDGGVKPAGQATARSRGSPAPT